MPDTRSIRLRNWRANMTARIDLTHYREASATTRIGVPEDGQIKRFVAFGLALLLVGLLVALDIALAARTVDQLARSEVHAGIYPASSVR